MLDHDAEMPTVRTTVRLDDDLYREVKERAAREGRTVASVLEDAVRVGMRRPAAPEAKPFVNVPFGRAARAFARFSRLKWRHPLDS